MSLPSNYAWLAAIANPPMPPVSVIAESPMSGLASSGPKPPRYSPSMYWAGPVNHWSPVPDTRMPKSVPLRAITVTTVEPGLYLRAAANVPERFAGIGIRIEDDAIVTEDGCELITRGVPVIASEIEALMRG